VTKLLSKDGEGERLDRFELVAELASGGMATVYLARLSGVAGFQRLFAIKRIHPHLAKETEFVEMFLDEARLAARTHHPNIASIQEIGKSAGMYYLVMDYIEGDTAARLFGRCAQAGKRIPHSVGIRIVLDALAGLHAAHELRDDDGEPLNVVHRDVSPQNVLVGVDGTSRVIDFGVARASSRLTTTRHGHLKGKLSYMAPEQARGELVDRRADVFAVGVMLWELLTFRRLFRGEGDAETLNRLLYNPIPTVSSADPSVPEALERVAMKALERDPKQRFASAWEFAEALESAARQSRLLGTTRDVAQCLAFAMGNELEAHRAAIRHWLSMDPGRSSGPPPSALTRSAPPAGASSVSSAVIPNRVVPLSAPPSQVPLPPPETGGSKRKAVWIGALSAVGVFATVVGWATFHAHAGAPPTSSTPWIAESASPADFPSPAPLATTDAPAPAPPDTGIPPAAGPAPRAAAVAAPLPPHGTAGRARPAPSARAGRDAAPVAPRPANDPAPSPRPVAPSAPVPDDLSHNPYR
jgi:eukaryotic-like serine/threonine-protein kinase